MKIEKKEIQKIEYKTYYVAEDGTKFSNEEECRKYEQTAKAAINCMFNSLKPQTNYNAGDRDMFCTVGCDDTIYAVKIRNIEDLEIVNKWIKSNDRNHNGIGTDAIGTIQLIDLYCESDIWVIGTPEQFVEKYTKEINKLFNELVEKDEEGENA